MDTTCIDCESAALKNLDFSYPLAHCLVCGLVFAREWRAEFDEKLYDYYTERLDWPISAFVTPENTTSLTRTLRGLERLTSGRRLLDVGCGEGQLVKAAVESGWDAQGIDLSESAVRICTERLGVRCSVVNLFDDAVGGPFDIVVMSELIEHVPGPSRYLRRAGELLAPGGIVYLTTPNFASMGRLIQKDDWRVIGPGHVAYFTPKVLRAKANKAGFRVGQLYTENLSVATLRHLLPIARPSLRGPQPLCSGAPADDQALRSALQQRTSLRVIASAVNRVLRATSLGEKIVAVLERPGSTNLR